MTTQSEPSSENPLEDLLIYSDPTQYPQLTTDDHKLLYEAWDWLVANDKPMDGALHDSKFIVARHAAMRFPLAIAEVRNWDYGKSEGVWVQLLYVRPRHRKQGIGMQLMRHLRDLYCKHGVVMGFGTHEQNEAMHKIGLSLNYKKHATFICEGPYADQNQQSIKKAGNDATDSIGTSDTRTE